MSGAVSLTKLGKDALKKKDYSFQNPQLYDHWGLGRVLDRDGTSSNVASGNWGLLDQEAALKWTQQNIASFGGDPSQIAVAADGSGADITSIHLLAGGADSSLFKKMLLMVSTVFF
ncbi:hypothetical protein JD844_015621 [Phrynosoma platyrhinos]|uniref:Carboxylesterase type B domain-containing protein n=1 Tax=Phrynosoma platyrhinos TaxID=52577 RepID=A0ABQ7SJD1_PHRPL|nr:hypothetical protein JD844_015621 [Phrynosoma platyrhinos]